MNLFSEPDSKAILLDIGTGTRDILLYSAQNSLENNAKIVAPTATRKMAEAVSKADCDLKIAGYTMGGGPLASALINHLQRGFAVEIEQAAAFTVRNNRQQLEEAGFIIKEKVDNPHLFFDEIELPQILRIFSELGENCSKIDLVGLSVQDHGDHAQNESSRRKRFSCFLNILQNKPKLSSLIFSPENLPEEFSRMRSGLNCIRETLPDARVVLMDTCIAAVAGCCFDEKLMNLDGPMLLVNFGNGHTLATVIASGNILSLYEHHTGMIKEKPEMVDDHLQRLVEGNLDFEEVFASGGHGCKTFTPLPFNMLRAIVATGPRRGIINKLQTKFYQAAPGGDMMMTGPLGLLKGYEIQKRQQ